MQFEIQLGKVTLAISLSVYLQMQINIQLAEVTLTKLYYDYINKCKSRSS